MKVTYLTNFQKHYVQITTCITKINCILKHSEAHVYHWSHAALKLLETKIDSFCSNPTYIAFLHDVNCDDVFPVLAVLDRRLKIFIIQLTSHF